MAKKTDIVNGQSGKAQHRELTEKQREVYKYVAQGGSWPTYKLAKAVDLPEDAVRRIVSSLRRRYRAGHKEVKLCIYTGKAGYTVEEKGDVIMYEASFRYKLGMGVLVNGMHVFARCQKVCSSSFKNLKLQYTKKKADLSKIL